PHRRSAPNIPPDMADALQAAGDGIRAGHAGITEYFKSRAIVACEDGFQKQGDWVRFKVARHVADAQLSPSAFRARHFSPGQRLRGLFTCYRKAFTPPCMCLV